MFDIIAGWFAAGLFVAGCWIMVGSFLPAPRGHAPAPAGRPPRPARGTAR